MITTYCLGPIPDHLRTHDWYAPHQAWLRDQGLPHHDPADADPCRATLVDANLVDVNLDGACLVDVNLDGAWLRGASLVDANLDGAWLRGARFIGTCLDGANLIGACLDEAVLDDASLDGASLDEAILDGADNYYTLARLIGERLRAVRRAGEVTQLELARRAGVSRALISMIESGSRVPTLLVLFEVARAVEADYRDLLPAPGLLVRICGMDPATCSDDSSS